MSDFFNIGTDESPIMIDKDFVRDFQLHCNGEWFIRFVFCEFCNECMKHRDSVYFDNKKDAIKMMNDFCK